MAAPSDPRTIQSLDERMALGEEMTFIALDVETANPNMASICAIGAAVFDGGQVVDEWYSLVDPQTYFSPLNVYVHGIDEAGVAGAPHFTDLVPRMQALIGTSVVVTHTAFDRTALAQAGFPLTRWLDSAMVARRTWAECAYRGYGLADVCERIGYVFQHHHALEDAKAAGHVLLAAMAKLGFDLDGMMHRVRQPINARYPGNGRVACAGNPDGPLAGEVVVFTGALSMPRGAAADLAAAAGCDVAPGVTRKTTLLVVGDIDVARLAGHDKSIKHRKAEGLAARGQRIRILRETDFLALMATTGDMVT